MARRASGGTSSDLRQQVTNSRMYLALGLATLLGLALLYVGGRDAWWEERAGAQALVNQLGGVVLAAVALSGLWEYVGKRSFAEEILEKVGIGSDIDRAGIVRFTDQYLKEVEWDAYFDDVTRLDIVFAYGRTWRRTHWQNLQAVAARQGARIRVVLPDPNDPMTMGVLADRFNYRPKELRDYVLEAAQDLCSLHREGGASISIHFRRGDQVFSCYRLDRVAVVTLYSHSRERTNVPTIVCESGGSLFEFIYKEINAMVDSATQIECNQIPASADPESAAEAATSEHRTDSEGPNADNS